MILPLSSQAPPPERKSRPLGRWLVLLLVLAAIPLLAPRCDAWHWSRHPPVEEHRRELLETVSKQFRCPQDQLTVSPEGSTGAAVVGCGSSTHLCWRQLARLWPHAWQPCE